MNWHSLLITEIEKSLNTTSSGIDNATAAQRLIKSGKNQITDHKKKTLLQMLLHQLKDFMIIILIVASIISGFLGDITDTVIILAIIILNSVAGLIQEYRAEKAMDALKKMAAGSARVIREGKTSDIPASDLVPGDLIVLEPGNIIPADIRFIETHQVKVDESALTGESQNVDKNSDELAQGNYALGDMLNMGYKGTSLTSGRAQAYVVATGMNTELGRIAKMIQTEEIITPLQKRLAAFGKRLTFTVLLVCSIIFTIGWLRGENILAMLLTSISLAVAAVPEALPALITMALAIGAKRLSKNNALIRKLPAVETLGSVTYICTDKTGTLTENKMTVQDIFEVPADQYDLGPSDENTFLKAMTLNNDSFKDESGQWIGDSTETALAQYAQEKGFERTELESEHKRIAELPFDPSRKCMSTLHQTDKGILIITKGAVDVLLSKLDLNQKLAIPEFEKKMNEMASRGNRVLGYAARLISSLPQTLIADQIESSLTMIGFAGLIDPPRKEAELAVTECKQAGIIPVMITGDHKLTAKAIAEQLGIITSEQDIVLTGTEVADMSEEKFAKVIEHVKVYARVNPEQKLTIIKTLQSKHHFVAMTGDGVNDAPALKNADIGIAMGINGTDVAKESAHMILLDDNFATIVVAIRHGRKIFDNILKFIKYIMTSNSGEIWAIFLAPFFGLPIPLLAIHILWINLITDGLPGLALASEPAEPNIMQRPPRNPRENIFTVGLTSHILWVGLLMGLVTIGVQGWSIGQDFPHWQTMAFTVLCLSQLGHVIAIRSATESFFTIGILSNKSMLLALAITFALQLMVIYLPFFNRVFKTQPLTLTELALTIAASTIVFWAVELEKKIKRLKR